MTFWLGIVTGAALTVAVTAWTVTTSADAIVRVACRL
jgi:hypothetical protein